MSVSEPQRLALHAAARRALGEEEGDTLMALSPPANTDMATMQALERTEERLGAGIDAVEAKLGARIDQVEAKVSARVEQVEAKLGARIDQVEAKVGARIDQVEAKVGARIDQVEAKVGARIDQVGARIDQVDVKIDNVAALILAAMKTSEATMRGNVWKVSVGTMIGTIIMVIAGVVSLTQWLS